MEAGEERGGRSRAMAALALTGRWRGPEEEDGGWGRLEKDKEEKAVRPG